MATPPSINRFYAEDYKDAPAWFKSRFLNTLNLFAYPVYNALNKNLTDSDNLNTQIVSLTVTGGATPASNKVSFLCTLQGTPSCIQVGKVTQNVNPPIAMTSTVSCQDWTFSSGSVTVNSIVGLTNGTSYTILLKVS